MNTLCHVRYERDSVRPSVRPSLISVTTNYYQFLSLHPTYKLIQCGVAECEY